MTRRARPAEPGKPLGDPSRGPAGEESGAARATVEAARRSSPIRTCVGCRSRAAMTELLRVVAIETVLVPDPRRRLPGRGAHLHPDLQCLESALRRQVFRRALRISGAPVADRLRMHLEDRKTGSEFQK